MGKVDITRLNNRDDTNIILYSAHAQLSVSHITFWMDSFLSTPKRFSILLRDLGNFKQLTELFPHLQICYAKTPIDVETVVNAHSNLEMVFYLSNLPQNIHMLRFNHPKHIFIGTQNSDWLSDFNKSYRAYDEFWGSGDFVINRLNEAISDLGHLKIKIVGKPQIADTLLSQNKTKKIQTHSLIMINNRKIMESILSFELYHPETKGLYLYISPNKKTSKDVAKTFMKKIRLHKEIALVESQNIFQNNFKDLAYIITDKKYLSPYLLIFKVPIFVYVKSHAEKASIKPHLFTEVLYFWHTIKELKQMIEALNRTQDQLQDEREKLFNSLFDVEATKKQLFNQNIL